eukprot:GFYU01066812.1.p2 GENE.GFYU01066812.1~~GFYU01066812.1.p2  ORF type:complete len:102 (+),score=7.24 GFYU01066812.1:241-546(+)
MYRTPSVRMCMVLYHQPLFSAFTDGFAEKEKTSKPEEKYALSHKAIVTMMRSWTGIICLTSDRYCFRSLVDTLRLPGMVSTRVRNRRCLLHFTVPLRGVLC